MTFFASASILLTRCFLIILSVFAVSHASATTSEMDSNTQINAVMMDNLVILQYHHVSTKTPMSTSIAPEKFAEHLAYLYRHFTVIDLPSAMYALQHKQQLPNRAVAITFDDGFANILNNAHPLLQRYGFPYTIFINPQSIGVEPSQLTWLEIKQMAQQNVTFANHTLNHLHMLNRKSDPVSGTPESTEIWLERIMQNINAAEAIIAKQVGYSLQYVAYPYGEYNRVLADRIKAEGYLGFAQHSGAVASHTDFSAIPRFPAAGRYANLKTLAVKLNSLAMPLIDTNITSPEIREYGDDFPTSMELTLATNDLSVKRVNCFFQGDVTATSSTANVVHVTLPEAFPVGRSRINCTVPSKQHKRRFYWFSQPFFKANAKALYPD